MRGEAGGQAAPIGVPGEERTTRPGLKFGYIRSEGVNGKAQLDISMQDNGMKSCNMMCPKPHDDSRSGR